MKKLMLGNAALARGLYEAGVSVVSAYPGTPSTEITEECAKYDEIYTEWAPNEKVAMEVAFGASLGGGRSFAAMKHVGLNVAADPLFTASYTGVGAGMVIAVADDPGMHSSQNEQDSRHYALAAKIPMLEPSDSGEAKDFAKLAFEISEEFDTPVFIKMCTRISHSQSLVELNERVEVPIREYVKDTAKNSMTPANAIRKHPIVEERLKRLREYSEKSAINRIELGTDNKIGIITSSTSYDYVKEVFGDSISILKLGMVYPLPIRTIREFASKVQKLVVVEELDPFIENACRNMGLDVVGKEIFPMEGELSQGIIRKSLKGISEKSVELSEPIPVRPPALCPGCPHRGLFYALKENNCIVMGDIGCYTLGGSAPLSAMDASLCMGASINMAHGFNKVNDGKIPQNAVAVIGDSTFIHSGMTGLCNVSYNKSNTLTIILDNSITGMTGHQNNPLNGLNIKGEPTSKVDLEALCRAYGFERVRVVDPYDIDECKAAIREELAAKLPSVIISRRPCILLKYVEKKPPISVDPDKCKGCKSCMKIGCPAVTFKDGKARIDETLCVGCNVCTELCKFDAFIK